MVVGLCSGATNMVVAREREIGGRGCVFDGGGGWVRGGVVAARCWGKVL